MTNSKPFQIFTGREVYKLWNESNDLVMPGEIDSNDALAIVLNRFLNEKGKRVQLRQRLDGKTHVDSIDGHLNESSGDLEALLLGEREISK